MEDIIKDISQDKEQDSRTIMNVQDVPEFLSENFLISGSSEQDIRGLSEEEALRVNAASKIMLNKTIHDLEESTKMIEIDPHYLTICGVKQAKDRRTKEYFVRILITSPLLVNESNLYKNGSFFVEAENMLTDKKMEMCKKIGLSVPQMKEIIERGYFIRYIDEYQNEYSFIPSGKFLTKLAKRAKMSKPEDGYDPFRDLYMVSKLKTSSSFKILYRENGKGRKKALTCYNSKFVPLRHSILITKMEEIHREIPVWIMRWEISHQLASLYLVFNDGIVNKDYAIGIKVSFSDTGEQTLQFQIVIYFEEYIFPVGKSLEELDVILSNYKKKRTAYRTFFERLPKISVDERKFITSMLLEEGERFAFGPQNTKRIVAAAEKDGGYNEKASWTDAIKHLLRFAQYAESEPANTAKRLYETLGNILDKY